MTNLIVGSFDNEAQAIAASRRQSIRHPEKKQKKHVWKKELAGTKQELRNWKKK